MTVSDKTLFHFSPTELKPGEQYEVKGERTFEECIVRATIDLETREVTIHVDDGLLGLDNNKKDRHVALDVVDMCIAPRQ
jgi:hypothetical protein